MAKAVETPVYPALIQSFKLLVYPLEPHLQLLGHPLPTLNHQKMQAIASQARVAPVGFTQRTINVNKASAFMGAPVGQRFQGIAKPLGKSQQQMSERSLSMQVYAVKDGTPLDRPLRVAVIGGGPSGACAAETLAQGGVEAFLIERKMDNCKVC